MKARYAGAVLGAVLFLVLASAGASAAPSAATVAFAKELRSDIKPKFAKEAPGLVLGAVTCTPPSKNVYHCLAHFSDKAARANVVYSIKATLKGRVITWSATAHSCTSSTTGRKLAC